MQQYSIFFVDHGTFSETFVVDKFCVMPVLHRPLVHCCVSCCLSSILLSEIVNRFWFCGSFFQLLYWYRQGNWPCRLHKSVKSLGSTWTFKLWLALEEPAWRMTSCVCTNLFIYLPGLLAEYWILPGRAFVCWKIVPCSSWMRYDEEHEQVVFFLLVLYLYILQS